jgi:hypothetical protein
MEPEESQVQRGRGLKPRQGIGACKSFSCNLEVRGDLFSIIFGRSDLPELLKVSGLRQTANERVEIRPLVPRGEANMDSERRPDPVQESVSRIAWKTLFTPAERRTRQESAALALVLGDREAIEAAAR